MSEIYVGIDPGVNGAIAIIFENEIIVENVPCIEIELTTKTKKGKKKKRKMIDLHKMCDIIFKAEQQDTDTFAILEKVHATPQMGVSSSFNFGYAFGAIESALAAFEIPYELVTPTKWKSEVGLRKGADKEESRLHARKLFPSMKKHLDKKGDHNKAEALLLAEYARRIKKKK